MCNSLHWLSGVVPTCNKCCEQPDLSQLFSYIRSPTPEIPNSRPICDLGICSSTLSGARALETSVYVLECCGYVDPVNLPDMLEPEQGLSHFRC